MIVFRICQVERTTNQLALQVCWGAYRGVLMNVVEGCAIYPTIILEIFRAYSQHRGGLNTVSDP
jgi:hypothetical protein